MFLAACVPAGERFEEGRERFREKQRQQASGTGNAGSAQGSGATLAAEPPGELLARLAVQPSRGTTATRFAFDASASAVDGNADAVVFVRWDWEDDGVWDTRYSTELTAGHRYDGPGDLTTRVQVRDLTGRTREATVVVPVVAYAGGAGDLPPTVDLSFSPDKLDPYTEAVFAAIVADDQTPEADLEVRWALEEIDDDTRYPGGPEPAWTAWSTDKGVRHQYPSAGDYVVHLEVRDGSGQVTRWRLVDDDRYGLPLTVQPDAPPVPSVTVAPDRVHVGETVHMDASATWDAHTDTAALQYRWDFDDDGVYDLPASGYGTDVQADHTYDEPGYHRLTVEVQDEIGNRAVAYGYVFVAAEDGILPKDGWPLRLDQAATAPLLADLDGDGVQDIVLASLRDWTYLSGYTIYQEPQVWIRAYHGDGTSLTGWPQVLIEENYSLSPPILAAADLDADGADELVVGDSLGRIHVLDGDGSPLFGSPHQVTSGGVSALALADLDGDGRAEVICTSGIYVYARQVDGSPVAGWPAAASTYSGLTIGAVGDVDGDGSPEVAAGKVILRADGRYVDGWGLDGTDTVAAFANLDDDPDLEVVLSQATYRETTGSTNMALDLDRTPVPGYEVPALEPSTLSTPLTVYFGFVGLGDLVGTGRMQVLARITSVQGSLSGISYSNAVKNIYLVGANEQRTLAFQPSAFLSADLDGDQAPDLLGSWGGSGTVDFYLEALNAQGTPLPGWPQTLPGRGNSYVGWATSTLNPSIGDVDGDGNLEVVVYVPSATRGHPIFVFPAGPVPTDPALMPWPMPDHDAQRTRCVR